MEEGRKMEKGGRNDHGVSSLNRSSGDDVSQLQAFNFHAIFNRLYFCAVHGKHWYLYEFILRDIL